MLRRYTERECSDTCLASFHSFLRQEYTLNESLQREFLPIVSIRVINVNNITTIVPLEALLRS